MHITQLLKFVTAHLRTNSGVLLLLPREYLRLNLNQSIFVQIKLNGPCVQSPPAGRGKIRHKVQIPLCRHRLR